MRVAVTAVVCFSGTDIIPQSLSDVAVPCGFQAPGHFVEKQARETENVLECFVFYLRA